MKLRQANRGPSFAWQAALILLPVLLLAIIGFLSMQQDRLLARQEATERAKGIAEALAPELWQHFSTDPPAPGSPRISFEANDRGDLASPKSYLQVPEPQHELSLGQLNTDQARLWTETQKRLDAGDVDAAVRSARELLKTNLAQDLGGRLCYELGERLAASGEWAGAIELFQTVVNEFPTAQGDTGLPLMPLARLKLFRLERKVPNPDFPPVTIESVCQALVETPSIVTPLILSELAKEAPSADERKVAQQWVTRWEEREIARKLYTAARTQPGFPQTNRAFWVEVPPAATSTTREVRWLVMLQSSSGGTNRFACRPESQLAGIIADFAQRPGLVPEYLGIGVEVADKRVPYMAPFLGVWREENWMGRRGGGVKRAYIEGAVPELLASAGEQAGPVRVSVYLASPTVMLKRQEARAFWFKLIIGASMASALVGLAAAYHAFDRQLRLNLAKTNFVSSVSHELRAPIASVRLMTESLESGRIPDPQRQKEYYRLMHQECRRLSSLVENVLDLSRIEQGRKQYEFEPTDLAALVRQTLELMRPQAAEHGIAFESNLSGVPEDQPLEVVVDGKAIQQALVNLVDNAVKHSQPGQHVIVGLDVVGTARGTTDEPDPGSRLALWVEDQGQGIPPEEHERIFEQFYRRGSELRRQTQGIGIGLSIVKHIVEAHSGRMVVRSAIGQGSRFTIELPIGPAAAQSGSQSHPAKPQ